MEDVRANRNQQRSAGKSTIRKELNKLTVTSVLSTEYMEGLTISEVIQALGLWLVRAPYSKEGRLGLGTRDSPDSLLGSEYQSRSCE